MRPQARGGLSKGREAAGWGVRPRERTAIVAAQRENRKEILKRATKPQLFVAMRGGVRPQALKHAVASLREEKP